MSGAVELLLDRLTGAGEAVWRASWQASVLALLVLAVQLVFGSRIAPRWRHALWVLVLVRLALPVVPSSRLSVFNLAPLRAEQPAAATDPMPAAVAPQQPLLSAEAFEAEMRARAARYTPAAAPADAQPLPPHVALTPAMPPPTSSPRDLWKGWPQALAAVWAAGVLLLALRVGWATWRVSLAMRRLEPVMDESVLAVLRSGAAELRVRRGPALLTGDALFSPALVGFVRPKLLLPRDLLARLDAAELRLVLLHELAHLKRRDVLVNWFATLLTVLHWPNPVAYLVAWRLRLERELATDELVMSRTATDADRRAYGHTIVKLLEDFARGASEAAPPRPAVPAGGVGILEGKQQMKRRITMIARFANRNRAWTVVAASLVLGLGVVALTDAAQQPPGPAEKAADPAPAKGAEAKAGKAAGPSLPGPEGEAKDYVVGANDLLQVTVYDLEGPGLQTIKTTRVSGTGNIALPFLKDPVRAQGTTERQLQEAVAKAYEKEVGLAKANVSVAVVEMRNLPKPKPEIAVDELVTVSVMDLTGAGVETVKTARVDAEGNISLPYVGRVKAAGLTSADFEQAVAKAYEGKKILHNALVAVSLPGRGESHRLSNKGEAPAAGAPGLAAPRPGFGGMPEAAMMGAEGLADEMGMPGGFAPADPFGGAPLDPAMKATLDRKLPEVNFDGVPLTDVVDFLRDVTSVNIFVDWRALEAAGIDRNAPVSARLKDVPFQDALSVVLRGVDHSLQFSLRNGIIQIGAGRPEPKPAQLSVSGYDVGDLIAAADDGVSGGAQAIANVISQTVRPDFWRNGGGGGGAPAAPGGGPGTISAFGNKVVVMATPEVHQEVEALLTVLRQPTTKRPTTKPAADEKVDADALWREKYAPHVINVNGQTNEAQLKQEFHAELAQRAAASRASGE